MNMSQIDSENLKRRIETAAVIEKAANLKRSILSTEQYRHTLENEVMLGFNAEIIRVCDRYMHNLS